MKRQALIILIISMVVPTVVQAGSVVAWGGSPGQCNVPSPNTGFVTVAGGCYHTLGLKVDRSIVAWGDNYNGQCSVPSPNSGFVAVSAGWCHSLGLKDDGSIVAWGSNYSGDCDVPNPNKGFVAVVAGKLHSLGLKADGSIMAWGSNYIELDVPSYCGQCDVPSPNTGFVAVAAGFYHSLGLKADGSIVAWGWNGVGQCNVPSPNSGFVAVSAGYYHSLGLKADGSIVAWGYNAFGQCDVPSPNTGFAAVAGGSVHSLGLKADGSIVGWGDNNYGQATPPAGNNFIAIAAGGYHSLGLKADTTPPPTTKQTIHVIVKDEKGNKIDKFHYDKSSIHIWDWDWSKEIYVRNGNESPYPNYSDIWANGGIISPHTYQMDTPKIQVEILQGKNLITWGYLEDKDTFEVPSPGLYLVRCTTTFQVDGETVIQQTGVPFGDALLVYPTWPEGEDENGKYEFYRIAINYQNESNISFTYWKRHTYTMICDTLTYVDAGEADWASICITKDPTNLGKLATGQKIEIKLPNPVEDATNITVQGSIGQVLDVFFKFKPLSAKGLLATEIANIIYLGVVPDQELNAEELIKAGASWAVTDLICLKLGIAGGLTGFIIGFYVDVAIESPSWFIWDRLQKDFTRSCVDDLTVETIQEGDTYKISLKNRGIPIHNVRLARYWQGDITDNKEYGVKELLDTGETYVFTNVPNNWFDTYNSSITLGTAFPMLAFNANLITKYCETELRCRYFDIKPENVPYNLQISMQSHCDLHIYDQWGRHLGVNYKIGEIEEDIPGTTFKIIDTDGNEVKYDGNTPDEGFQQIINVPVWADNNYIIELVGTSDGPFHLTINGIKDGNEISSNAYEGEIVSGERLATIISVEPTEDNLNPSFTSMDVVPIANAGPNQIAYAWIDGIAKVNLEGSGSYDDDNDLLTYQWSWTIDGNDYEANGVKPMIELPVGQYVISLIVNDGIVDSEPNEVNITVVGPIEANLCITPKVLNCRSNQPRIMTTLRLPKGITKEQIDTNEPILLYPGEIEADWMWTCPPGRISQSTTIFASFDKDELMDAIPDNGRVELAVVGRLKTGQYFFGTDNVTVICPGSRPRPWHRPWYDHRWNRKCRQSPVFRH